MTYRGLASVHRKIYKENKKMFKNKRFITKGVSSQVGLLLQLFMWQCIDEMKMPKNYLRVFEFTLEDEKQKGSMINVAVKRLSQHLNSNEAKQGCF